MQLRKIRVMLCCEKMFSPLCFVQIICPNIFSLIYWCISKLLHTQYLTFLSKNRDISHLCSCTLPYSHHVTCKCWKKCSITSSQKKLTFPVVHCFLFAFKKKRKLIWHFFNHFARLIEIVWLVRQESRSESVVWLARQTFGKYFLLKVVWWTQDGLGDKHLVVLCTMLIAICVYLIRPDGTKANHCPETIK